MHEQLRGCIENKPFEMLLEAFAMWKLFDFNSDGKTSRFEKVVGTELINNAYRLKAATTVNN